MDETTKEILMEIRDELRALRNQSNEIYTKVAVLDSYDVPQLKREVNENQDRLTRLETQLKTWAAGAAFLSFVLSILIQQAVESVWRN